ncbi:MAG: hypothetical protein WDM78_11455 [Puia sp.]
MPMKSGHEGMTMEMGNKVGTMGHAGHDHHAMMIADFRRRFYVVLVLTLPIMLLSETIQHWAEYSYSISRIKLSSPPFVFSCLLLWRMAFFKRMER